MKTAYLMILIVSLAMGYSWQAADDGTPIQWPGSSIPPHYLINQNGTPDCPGETEFDAVQNGHNSWGAVSGQYFSWAYDGTTPLMPGAPWGASADGNNVMGWYESWSSSGSTIAVNITWYWPSNGDIVECDQAFNGQNYTWSATGQSGRMDVENINAHETGHTLMLLDLYYSGASEFTMYGYASLGETKKRTLEYDDEDGIRFLYPNDSITIISFEANPARSGVEVAWTAQEDSEHAGYNLYRRSGSGATKGNLLTRQGYVRVNADMITGSSSYKYLDSGAGEGIIQYILADVDVNGHESYHGPVSCNLTGKVAGLSLSASPNPVSDVVKLRYILPVTAGEGDAARMEIRDLGGKLVKQFSVSSLDSEQEVCWDTSSSAPGVYTAILESDNQRVVKRVVVKR